MARNSLGILVTPRIDVKPFFGDMTSYVGETFQKLVDIVIKSFVEHKLLCIDLFNSDNNDELFGITNIVKSNNMYVFGVGHYNANQQNTTGIQYVFSLDLAGETIGCERAEI